MSEPRAGRVGKSYPAVQHSNHNSAPTAQAHASAGDRVGLIALILGILALLVAIYLALSVSGFRDELQNIRGLIENSAQAAAQSAVEAALASERADKAERSAAINREYAVQVVGQLNRMGFPVMSPGEKDHPLALPEDYARLDEFAKQQQEK